MDKSSWTYSMHWSESSIRNAFCCAIDAQTYFFSARHISGEPNLKVYNKFIKRIFLLKLSENKYTFGNLFVENHDRINSFNACHEIWKSNSLTLNILGGGATMRLRI